jgi:signal transduction histidine kinase
VATELDFILGRSRELAGLYPQERAFIDIASAATHALDGSRTAIRGLRAASSGNLTLAVQTRARELARRAGLQLTLDVPEQIEASAEVEHAVLSIVQEAIANASRHADAERLELSLRAHGDTILVRISDDGSGFDSVAIAPPRPGHLGLSSMQERAQILGGDLRLQSVRGHGTTIELELS